MGVTLVTNNEADFVGFNGLKIENWVVNRPSHEKWKT
jgi:predicted nucleic acid-binding protein